MTRPCAALAIATLCLGISAVPVRAGECETAAKAALGECTSQCADKACRAQCTRAQKTDLAACRRPGARADASPFKGAGTAASPFAVGSFVKATTLKLDDTRSEYHFTFRAPKDGRLRLYLTDYTSPIDVTFEAAGGGSKTETTHFIKAPDYPAYARYDVEEGQHYVYSLRLVASPSSVTLSTALDDNCRLNNQFVSLPFGGTCKDQE